jgi:hypothetical protein
MATSSGPACVSVPAASSLGSKQASAPIYTPGACQPSGGENTGSVQPVDPFTFCCRPGLRRRRELHRRLRRSRAERMEPRQYGPLVARYARLDGAVLSLRVLRRGGSRLRGHRAERELSSVLVLPVGRGVLAAVATVRELRRLPGRLRRPVRPSPRLGRDLRRVPRHPCGRLPDGGPTTRPRRLLHRRIHGSG